MNKERNQAYEIIRFLLVILVIIGHCYFYDVGSIKYGGVAYYTQAVEKNLIVGRSYDLLGKLTHLIYIFHMPFFIFLSGAIFCITFNRNKSFKSLFFNKIKRLIVPFIIVSLFFSIPLKLASGYFTINSFSDFFVQIIVGQILIQGNTHLWFLPTLFVLYLIIYWVEKISNNKIKLAILMLFLLLNFSAIFVEINAFNYVLKYLFWFYLGFTFHKYEIGQKIISRKFLFLCIYSILILISLFVLIKYNINMYINYFSSFSFTICIIGLLYVLSELLSKTHFYNTRVCKFVSFISVFSFGLYLYSDPINYVILKLTYNIFGLEFMVSNFGIILLYLSRFIISTIVAFAITSVIKKFKIKYVG